MEQEPLFRCHDCTTSKPREEFSIRKRDSKHGVQRDVPSRCASCAATERERCKIRKRKRDEKGLDLSGGPEEPNRPMSIEQFTTLLREKALTGVFSFSARVSAQGLAGNADDICKVLVARVWEATGFRFTYGRFPLEGQWLMLTLFN